MNAPVFLELLARRDDGKRELAVRPAQRSKIRAGLAVLLLSVFYTATAQGQYQVLHHLAPSEGGGTISLIEGSDGKLYGTALGGGDHPDGTLFRLSRDGTGFEVLHHFDGTDGRLPARRMVEGSDGNFYGTARLGGDYDRGTLFRMSPDGSAFTVLHHFNATDGTYGGFPESGLIEGSDGNYYGTTPEGGSVGCGGTLFRMSPSGILEIPVLHSFTGDDDGCRPEDRLLEGSDGKFYGTTAAGGPDFGGTIFRMTPSGLGFEVLHTFGPGETAYRLGGLVEGSDGYFYGTTSGTDEPYQYEGDWGSVYRISPSGVFETLYFIDPYNGDNFAFPTSSLVVGSDGNLYGRAQGAIFRTAPSGAFSIVAHCCFELPNDGLIEGSDGFLYVGGNGEVIRLSAGNSATATTGQSVTVSTAPQMPATRKSPRR